MLPLNQPKHYTTLRPQPIGESSRRDRSWVNICVYFCDFLTHPPFFSSTCAVQEKRQVREDIMTLNLASTPGLLCAANWVDLTSTLRVTLGSLPVAAVWQQSTKGPRKQHSRRELRLPFCESEARGICDIPPVNL